MPIVFVHGVNTRGGAAYDNKVNQRNEYLRQYTLTGLVDDPSQVQFFNPYWGDLAAKLAWNHASLPTDRQEAMGIEDDLASVLTDRAIELTTDPDDALLKMAQHSPPESLLEVVDLLLLPAMQTADAAQLAELIPLAHKIHQYVALHPEPDWLQTAQNDQEFLLQLQQAVDAWQPPDTQPEEPAEVIYESFGAIGGGAWQALEWGAMHLQQSFSRVSGQVVSAGRTPIHKTLSIFLGDAFKYLQMRGTKDQPGTIIETVVADLDAAVAAKTAADPYLILIAHSMGGNICYDILSYYRPDLQVDAFVTVGSQVSLFEELKLFNLRVPNVPGPGGDRVPKLSNIARWLNIYNTNDVLSFACDRVFAEVVDYEFPAGSLFGMRAAHGLYFERISFYERLAYRLRRMFE